MKAFNIKNISDKAIYASIKKNVYDISICIFRSLQLKIIYVGS